ncbi:MAG: ABC-type multidrug transport system ATPase subunit [Myxococcota bacterium]|jgi:ABC-type multidrug transport system ATPase subunit
MLEARGLGVQIGSTTILQEISLLLHPGELCALIGPSGAGKSTLIKVLLGLRNPSEGSVTVNGGPITAAGPVGYVPQDDALHRSLTVRQSLTFSARLRLHELDEASQQVRIGEVCEQVGLEERLDVRIRALSGGQRKRVSVALELLSQPGLLILDEPTSGLDPGLEAKMMGLFAEVAGGGRVVMVATHAMQSLSRCDVLAVLVRGRLAWLGRPADALSWFEVDRFAGIFDQLPRHAPPVWARRWMGSPQCRSFAARSAPTLRTLAPASEPTKETPPAAPDLKAQLEALKSEYARKDS